MKKFWGICNNDKYAVGCNGASIYIYERTVNNYKYLKILLILIEQNLSLIRIY